MTSLTFKKIAGSTVATVLALGLTTGVSGVASAAQLTPSTSSVANAREIAFQGRVSLVTPAHLSGNPATSEVVTVVSNSGVTKSFVVTHSTKVHRAGNGNNSVTLMRGERVVVLALPATPTVARLINVMSMKVSRVVTFEGRIISVVEATTSVTPAAMESVTVVSKAGAVKVFILTSSTKLLRSGEAQHPVTLIAGERVIVRALAVTPHSPLTIDVVGAR